MKIRIRVGDFRLGEVEREAIRTVLGSGVLSEGKNVYQFEKRWASYIGTEYCVATSSGSAGLIAGLLALKYMKGLTNGAKVITTPLTYIATSSAISAVGFQPEYVDVDPRTFNITPENVRLLLEEKDDPSEYAVMMPVHLMGYPVEMDEMNAIAEQYDLLTFEDAAQAHGTLYKGKRAGAMSMVSAFSFYIAHNIQAGEMGAVMTNDPEIHRLVRKIKTQGRMCDCPVCTRSSGVCPQLEEHSEDGDFDPRFVHDLIGHNFKAMEFQAALAVTQIEKADWIIKKRRSNVKHLNSGLESWENILQLPGYSDEIGYLAYPLVIKDPELISRKRLRRRLEEEGVETRPLFGCIPTQQPAYSHLRSEYEGRLPNAEYLGLNAFYIGCHQYLEEDDLDYVLDVFGRVLSEI